MIRPIIQGADAGGMYLIIILAGFLEVTGDNFSLKLSIKEVFSWELVGHFKKFNVRSKIL